MPRLLLVLLLSFAALTVCRAQEDAPAPADQPTAEQILQSAGGVEAEVAELLHRQWKQPVAKAVMTKTELRTELQQMMQKELGNGKRERLEAWLRTLALLSGERDLEQTMTDVLLSQIGGFYDPERKKFFMMAEAAAYGELLNRMMIAHELCHALDDQYVDLRALQRPSGREPTEDETYVVGSLIEGSATALMFHWMAQAMQHGADLREMTKMAEQQQDQMKVLLEAPPYFVLLAATYMVGFNFVTKGQATAGMPPPEDDDGNVIVEVAAHMPRSSEQMLHPDKYWVAEKRDEPVLLADDGPVVELLQARTGQHVVERNTLGELVLALVAGPLQRKLNPVLMARSDYWTNAAAKGWGGDRMFLLADAAPAAGKPLAAPGVVLVTAWDTGKDRDEFVAAVGKYRGETPGFELATDGKVAVFAFGSARKLGDAGLQAVLAAATFTQDGRPWQR